MKALPLTAAVLASLLMAGCATRGGEQPDMPPVDDRAASAGADQGLTAEEIGAEAAGAQGAESFIGDELDDPASPLSTRVIYFGFDSNEVSSEDMAVLQAHGRYLSENPDQQIVIEGHTDERGSREYNLALGERRADAVKQVLVLSGASEAQIESVSFGEEKPAALGSNEEAWAENRRAELLYTQQ